MSGMGLQDMGYSMVRITGSEQAKRLINMPHVLRFSALLAEAVAVAKALLDGRINEKRTTIAARRAEAGSNQQNSEIRRNRERHQEEVE